MMLSDEDRSFQIFTTFNPAPVSSQVHFDSLRSAAEKVYIIEMSTMAWYVVAPTLGITVSYSRNFE